MTENSTQIEFEYVVVLIEDLKKIEQQKEFAGHLLNFIEKQIKKSKSRLDPQEFRGQYVLKTYTNSDF
jgi:hypothetical protein